MNKHTNAVRTMLRELPPSVSVPLIKSYDLPADEEISVIMVDCYRKDITRVADMLFVSVETVKRRRKSAFVKIHNAMERA